MIRVKCLEQHLAAGNNTSYYLENVNSSEREGAEKMSISINVFQTVGFNPLGNHENNLVTQKNKEQKDTKQSN